MSNLGIRWEIDGIPAASITRSAANGRFRITFERSKATLEQIEQINWSAPALTHPSGSVQESELPAGCGFTLVDLSYQHADRVFIAELQTTQQHPVDIAGYQAEHQQRTRGNQTDDQAYGPVEVPDPGSTGEVQA